MTENYQPVDIAIIGGGFCGILTAIHLLRDNGLPLHIHIINKGYAFARGVAYDPHTALLLLNVPNGRMSAFPDMPDHFVLWLMKKHGYADNDKLAAEYSTRQQYGDYLDSLWQNAMDNLGVNKSLSIYHDQADDIIEDGRHLKICLRDNPALIADVAILATGNNRPHFVAGLHESLKKSGRYFGDPWKKGCVENTGAYHDVLIVGNGLTMVDAVIGLAENGFKQTIHTVSPHGYRLNPSQEDIPPYNDNEIATIAGQEASLIKLVNTFNKHRKIADRLNQSVYPLVDSLRPKIQTLWLSFSAREKQQFISYLSIFWERVRHRLPAWMYAVIENMRAEGKLVTHKGHIVSAAEADGMVKVVLNCGTYIKHLTVQRIINCTGPEIKINRLENELLNNLAQKGIINAAPCHLGIHTHPDGRVITTEGMRKDNLFVIGSNLKGMLWESTAVPELREQAQKLAQHLLSEIYAKHTQAITRA